MDAMLWVLAGYVLFGLGVSVGILVNDSDALDEPLLVRVSVVLVGMLVWPMIVHAHIQDRDYQSWHEFDG